MADEDDSTDIQMPDADAAEEEHKMYGHGSMTEQELDVKYPNRPHNHSKTLPFHDLFLTLFNPLNENKKKPAGPIVARKKLGPHVASNSPNEIRRQIIERFISRWKKEVGFDIYPAFRLIVPEKDRDRAMYGLKEMTLGKLLVRVMKIDKNSEDGYNLLHWKLPGVKSSSAMAGDFAGRCFEVLSKRPMRSTPGDMSIAEVNELLDRLSVAEKEENQQPIMQEFYNRMNAEELMWLIRMILRQMKVGATEKTIFELWHPDAENLFNISSSLRRVCWELYDKDVRLEGDDAGITLMQCFQPQLAAFQLRSMDQMIARMNMPEDDAVFWIEEKLDGERMQLHMMEDDSVAGGKRFGFWSRKAKDYTYLYGNGFEDEYGALTRHLGSAFVDGVRNIILDGEMITWDPATDAMVPFGHLKTAALSEQQNPFADGKRPLFRIFDCLYLNDVALTRYTLRKRREALAASVKTLHRRFEVHEYTEATQASEIETRLRNVIAESTEGLVLKNPRSMYRLNERNDDWIKVKPEYMTEFGEALDCIVIGGYYGSGKRGGRLSSFMCGLPVNKERLPQGGNPQKCVSFFKVGGGFTADDYAQVRHLTEGKWTDWDSKKPPVDWIELAGGNRQLEKPDMWIKPEDSIVLAVKAASVTTTDTFRSGCTLRFPRFKKLRTDKDWKSALSYQEFFQLKIQVEEEVKEKQLKIDDAKQKRTSRKRKREVIVQGQEDEVKIAYAGAATNVFEGLQFYILTDAKGPIKKTKAELQQMVKANGGKIVASRSDPDTVIISDSKQVTAESIRKDDKRNILRTTWLLDCIKQAESDVGRPALLLPLEMQRHLWSTRTADVGKFDENADIYGDSYCRDLTEDELSILLAEIPKSEDDFDSPALLAQVAESSNDLDDLPGWMFRHVTAYCVNIAPETKRLLSFGGAHRVDSFDSLHITHVIVPDGHGSLSEMRKTISARKKIPLVVTSRWVHDSWTAKTRLDEERKYCRLTHCRAADQFAGYAAR